MENQVENTEETLNVKGIILLLGVIFGGLISIVTHGGILPFIIGGCIGLIVAIVFISACLPHKSHDR